MSNTKSGEAKEEFSDDGNVVSSFAAKLLSSETAPSWVVDYRAALHISLCLEIVRDVPRCPHVHKLSFLLVYQIFTAEQ